MSYRWLGLPWWAYVLVIAMTVLTVELGFWQLRRADEKAQWLNDLDRSLHAPAQHWDGEPTQAFQHASLQGHYSGQQWLLENQTEGSALGYHVLSVFVSDNGHSVVVDRGFVARTGFDGSLPKADVSTDAMAITGHWYLPMSPWRTTDYRKLPQSEPMVLPVMDWAQLLAWQQEQQLPLTAMLLHLDPDAPQGFIRHWKLTDMQPERHRSYAWQWFLLAAVLDGLFLLLIFKSSRRHEA